MDDHHLRYITTSHNILIEILKNTCKFWWRIFTQGSTIEVHNPTNLPTKPSA